MWQKNRKAVLFALLSVGALLMFMGRFLSPAQETENPLHHERDTAFHAAPLVQNNEAHATEERLEEFFSLIQGAGRVRVMVGVSSIRETVFAVDSIKNENLTREEDAQGGTRETSQVSESLHTVLIPDRNGTTRPLVLRETEPSVQGIIIIAEGGDDPAVRAALTRAAQAVLGIEVHRIQVLTMK